MNDEMTEERRLELLRRVLQYDIEDAVCRYEAEAGCCVVEVKLRLDGSDGFRLEMETDSRRPPTRSVPPAARMLIINLNR